jgi:predicted GNAT family acetyltransferase
MIRKLNEDDRESALRYLSAEPSFNTFAIGDIENFGFDADFQDVWGEFDEDGAYRALVLRYHNHFIVYSADESIDKAAVRDVVGRADAGTMVSGKERLAVPLAADLGLDCVRLQYLAELRSTGDVPADLDSGGVEWATPAVFDEVFELQRSIEEFGNLEGSADAIRHNMESGTGRTVLVRRDGRAVSSASSAAESSRAAMIIGVCTAKDHRGQGLATACMVRLCRTLLYEGKVVCLFYDNPAAGRIYKRIGFRDVGRWATAMRGRRGVWRGFLRGIDTDVPRDGDCQ